MNCANCGGERGIHHYQTDQCPVGGREASGDRPQEYKTSTFAEVPFDPPVRLAKDLTVREHFAAMALQGVMSADLQDQLTYQQSAEQAVKAADALIEALNA